MDKNKVEAQSIMDLLRMLPRFVEYPISDKEAATLYDMWQKAPPGQDALIANISDADSKVMAALLNKGYIKQSGPALAITDKGRKIIVEMVTSAPNALDKKAKMPTYRQIKTKTARSSSQTFTKRASQNKSEPFNLKKRQASKK